MQAKKSLTLAKAKGKKQAVPGDSQVTTPTETDREPFNPLAHAQARVDTIEAIERALAEVIDNVVDEIYENRCTETKNADQNWRLILQQAGPGDIDIGPYLWRALPLLHDARRMIFRAYTGAENNLFEQKRPTIKRERPFSITDILEDLHRTIG